MSVGSFLQQSATESKKLLGLLAILAVLVLCANLLFEVRAPTQKTATSGSSATVPSPPPFTPAVQAQLAASKGFQVLVSYTSRGFEPAIATVKRGGTVRFTDNSSGDMWVASAGPEGRVYPAVSRAECGQSAFDSCRIIKPGEFWEFTFEVAGTWGYQNNVDTNARGTVEVK